jgi:hypothetical protein
MKIKAAEFELHKLCYPLLSCVVAFGVWLKKPRLNSLLIADAAHTFRAPMYQTIFRGSFHSENVFIADFPIDIEREFGCAKNLQELRGKRRLLGRHEYTMSPWSKSFGALSQIGWRGGKDDLKWALVEPSMNPSANIVGRGLPAILEMNLRFRNVRLRELQEGGINAYIGAKLPFGSVAGKLTCSLHFFSGAGHFSSLVHNRQACKQGDANQPPVGPFEGCVPLCWRIVGVFGVIVGYATNCKGNARWTFSLTALVSFIRTGIWLTGCTECETAE